ncbi:MAG: DNA polymerase I [Deltaproteobacteria bacterium]|nr:DNA polymerase I [Deltaproteobacteria bacterium]
MIYLIDGSSYIYRAFYAVRALSTSKGLPTGAVYGFTRMIMKLLKDFSPIYIAIAFDAKGPTFRHKIFEEYKANRPTMPEELIPQVPYIKEIVQAFGIPIIEIEGYEADDIIGTLANKAYEAGFYVVIVSGDKDMNQLINDRISIIDTMRDEITDINNIKDKFGVQPSKVIEVMGLAGDTSDNVPGVPGIGLKTAVKLINQFSNIENIYNHLDEIKGKSLKEKLLKNKEQALLSRTLVTIDKNVPIDFSEEKFKIGKIKKEEIIKLYHELEFSALLKEILTEEQKEKKIKRNYKIITKEKELDSFVSSLISSRRFVFDTETTSKDAMRAKLVGISFCMREGEAFYIPLAHSYKGVPNQIPFDTFMAKLKPILEDFRYLKIGHNIKYDLIVLARAGISLRGIDGDTMVASYLLNPLKPSHSLDALAREELNLQKITYKELAGTGKKEVTFDKVDVEKAKDYSCEDSEVTFILAKRFFPELEKQGLMKLFKELEMPLVVVLAKMEMNGVKVDKAKLTELSKEFEQRMREMEKEIYKMAGEPFNINSPKQLSVVLFEKLKLPVIKKGKTGYSTNEAVLTQLAQEHPLPETILKYRELMKLKSTYVDALLKLIHPETGRIHTSYNQTVTATGRLSSSNPNLQNIPIRSEEGKRIRRCFIPEDGYILLSADYSQIELRVLAHISGDENLISAFKRGEDIHNRTACEIFGVKPEDVTEEMRRQAKTINFGIIYGMGAFGLASQLSIDRSVAQEYIDAYLSRYPGVSRYIEKITKDAEEKGYVETLLGRRRMIPEIKSTNKQQREFARRTAINTPIQGTAADFIKKAMLNIQKRIDDEKLKSRMILQVHDELVFEVPESEVERLKSLIKDEMEHVYPTVVELKVDVNIGRNWGEAH